MKFCIMARNRNGETRYVQFKWNFFIDFYKVLENEKKWRNSVISYMIVRDAIGRIKLKWSSIKDFK